ncbi:unnamed protein product [Spirodela intermedia]|uniref:Uncharacterized protein n=1 Tax=Spirodela intermedia TaxID=51605 RepID=A0A7I8KNS8_SPIIN|nr:unnamed protein product [Spirodela intermedia]
MLLILVRRDRIVVVMTKYDGEGLFSSDWIDAVLGIRGKNLSVEKKGTASWKPLPLPSQ